MLITIVGSLILAAGTLGILDEIFYPTITNNIKGYL